MSLVQVQHKGGILCITLDDAQKRNALGIAMFDAIDVALQEVHEGTRCVLLLGHGSAFCSGFDMKECAKDLSMLEQYILRLSALIKSLRRMPMPVVAGAHGAAIAGGCAVISACDFVVGESTGKFGYPVHRIGISPAVTIPTLFQKLGEGHARTLVMSGEIISGTQALSIGLLTNCVETSDDVFEKSWELAKILATKPPHALQATKQWLNELDGSLDDETFDIVAKKSAQAIGEETKTMLNDLWEK